PVLSQIPGQDPRAGDRGRSPALVRYPGADEAIPRPVARAELQSAGGANGRAYDAAGERPEDTRRNQDRNAERAATRDGRGDGRDVGTGGLEDRGQNQPARAGPDGQKSPVDRGI